MDLSGKPERVSKHVGTELIQAFHAVEATVALVLLASDAAILDAVDQAGAIDKVGYGLAGHLHAEEERLEGKEFWLFFDGVVEVSSKCNSLIKSIGIFRQRGLKDVEWER